MLSSVFILRRSTAPLSWARSFSAAARKSANKKIDVDDEYKRLTPLEHILKCPNMYIGATSMTEKVKSRFVVSSLTKKSVLMERLDVPYIPGIVKIFDEVLVNACDNAVRDPVGTKNIDVTYEASSGTFSVRNSGQGIPVIMHRKEKLYVPELVLGQLLTGSNFEKVEANATGGRHGYGAKLCNVFSSSFSVETVDANTGLYFRKNWKDNMTSDGDAMIEPSNGVDPYTLVKFTPDWKRFGLTKIDAGSLRMIKTRVVETAGLLGPNVTVTWNTGVVPVESFEDFCQACAAGKDGEAQKFFFSEPTPRLRVAIGLSNDGFVDTSFVNLMSTWRGGSHVDSIVSQISNRVLEVTKRTTTYSERDVKKHLQIYVDFRTNHPEFDSQSKDRLTSNLAKDPSIQLPELFLKRFVDESGILDLMQASASAKVMKQVNKRVAAHTIPKLEDAFKAGTSESDRCTLILTEGDSAKALAMEGIAVVGRKHYGVYPLRGKLLNVRDKSIAEVAENREVLNIMNALGLKVGAKAVSGLRYGRVMFMTDQDHDGFHIKGLLLNLFDQFWPELAQKPGFLTQFITPLLKAKPRQQGKPVLEFYNEGEFVSWIKARPNFASEYKVKYYKGLGTSTAQEAREYFAKLDKHVVDFAFTKGSLDRELIDKVFRSSRAQERKDWLTVYRKAPDQAQGQPAIASKERRVQTVDNFINTDLAGFSWHDVERSIPSLLDGFKPSQRKVFYALNEKVRSPSDDIKVAQLAGYVAEVTAYHHGEKSLVDTIVNMAQDFVGSNNVPLLRSEGQFGTRLQGGADAAAGRYIFTGLSPLARSLYCLEDDPLLVRREEDGVKVEPKFYVPVVPVILINGCEGIGTGWSSFVPAHHPLQVVDAVETLISTGPSSVDDVFRNVKALVPWYKRYKGDIRSENPKHRFECHGIMELVGNGEASKLVIKELPLGVWTEDFKEKLIQHVTAGRLSDFKDDSADPSQVRFELYGDKLELFFNVEKPKFRSFLDMRNMHLFNRDGAIQKFNDVREILYDFYVVRLEMYVKRRESILAKLGQEREALHRELLLTKRVVDMDASQVRVLGRSSNEFVQNLEMGGFSKPEVERFLKKPIGDFSSERVKDLETNLMTKEKMLQEMTKATPQSLWMTDLQRLRQNLSKDPSFGDVEVEDEATQARIKLSTMMAPSEPPKKRSRSKLRDAEPVMEVGK